MIGLFTIYINCLLAWINCSHLGNLGGKLKKKMADDQT